MQTYIALNSRFPGEAQEMNDEEVIQMMGVYLVEMLKMKMAQEGQLNDWESPLNRPRYH